MSVWSTAAADGKASGKGSDGWMQKASKDFSELGVEVKISTPVGDVWMVPRHTGKRRRELTADEAFAIFAATSAFDGKVTAWGKASAPPEDVDFPDADEPPEMEDWLK